MKKLLAFLFLITLTNVSVNSAKAETGYDMWLRYTPIEEETLSKEYLKYCRNIISVQNSEMITSSINELKRGIGGMLGVTPKVAGKGKKGIVIGTIEKLSKIYNELTLLEEEVLNNEGYIIRNIGKAIIITGKTDQGVLYGTFRFLRIMQMHKPLNNLNVIESPKVKLRYLNHWDNPGKHTGRAPIERGYAGNSIFKWEQLPELNQRYTDYARMLASVGINGSVLNNVNTAKKGLEGWKLLSPEYLPKIKALAGVFRSYGIKLYISVNFFSPVKISGLSDADPFNPEVEQWWQNKANEIYSEIPDFGGFLVKADSEGEPGPIKYERTHADGANMIAKALKPHGGIVFWRAFVYAHGEDVNPDRACQAFDMFKPLDGKFDENVVVQIKNGPIDFQVREPVSPLFGAMPNTQQMIEVQITQEYTGHTRHVCYLAPQWKEILDFDTHAKGKGSTVSKVIDGSLYGYSYSGIAGVSNIGDAKNWTGHLLAQANTYGFGRLAWNPELSSEEIAEEWANLTFGNNDKVNSVLNDILLTSWKTYEGYTSPLGVGFMSNSGMGDEGHFYPAPDKRTKYHKADEKGVGYDRSKKTGSGFPLQYFEPNRSIYEDPNKCPDELLLFLHHVPYNHRLQSGKTVIQHIYDSHNEGVEKVTDYYDNWKSMEGLIDTERFTHVLKKLEGQIGYAKEWRDAINAYFYQVSGIKDHKLK